MTRLVLPYPQLPEADAEAVPIMLATVRKLAARIDSRQIDRDMDIPSSVLDELRQLGLFGLVIPAQYGGIGLSPSGYARVIEELGGVDMSCATTLGAHQAIGCRGITLFGTEEQKQRYLPNCARGEWLASLAMTEPDAGSAIANTKTRARQQPDGSWVLNGQKTYITNGGWSHVFTVFARTELAKGDVTQDRLSGFIVERGAGVANGTPMHKMGIRGSSTTEIFFSDARAPADNQLGQLGGGLRMARDIMVNGRVGLAAGCIGVAKHVLALATRHATGRVVGGMPIAKYDLIRRKLGEAALDIFVAESMVYMTTGLMGHATADFSVESAACKIVASETAVKVAHDAVQIGGGAGYVQDYPFERIARDVRITTIFEGTTEILKLLVAMNSLEGPIKRIARLGGYLAAAGAAPALPHALADVDALADRALDTADAAVAATLATHGGNVSRLQLVQAALAELAIESLALCAVLSRASAASPSDRRTAGLYELARAAVTRSAGKIRRLAEQLQASHAAGTSPDAALLAIADQLVADDAVYPFDAAQRS